MDAILTDTADLAYCGLPPVLLAASSEAAMARAERTTGAAGLRVGARLRIERASARIGEQAAASALWIELDTDLGPAMDELLTSVSLGAGRGCYAAVVSATAELLDAVAARSDDNAVELIVDAGEAERVAALALAMTKARLPSRLCDVASDASAERLRQLSEEVNRIASTLARLSAGPVAAPASVEISDGADLPPVSAAKVRAAIQARRLRDQYFPEGLFADPAWDMLLDLFHAEIGQLRVPVSSLCIAAAVPATTALRWLRALVDKGLFIRHADPRDGRRVFVELAPEASRAMRRYFAELDRAVAS